VQQEDGMSIALWGRLSSNNVQKVVWTLEEVGAPYRHIDTGGRFGGLDDPAYRAMNPNGKVPTLRDDDTVVWESHAIVRYLAAAYSAGALWPETPRARAVADQWTDWTATTFQPAWIEVFWLLVRTPPERHDKQAITAALARTRAAFALLEQRLSDTPVLAGDGFTYADIVAGVSLYRWTSMEIERPVLPGVEAWHERLLARPAFRQAVCVSYAELVGRLAF
jgi:glutathione S-transferase